MKKTILLAIALLCCFAIFAQTATEKFAKDAIATSHYDIVSSSSQDPWQFERDNYIHSKNAVITKLDATDVGLPKHNWNSIFTKISNEQKIQKREVSVKRETNEITINVSKNDIDDILEPGERITVKNAGVVIIAAFLPAYYERLGMLENGTFKDFNSRERGAYLLQYLVYYAFKFDENELPLNKILMGIPITQTTEQMMEITQEEKDLSDSLLIGVISNWEKVKNSSTIAIQESFLQRDGIITIEDDKYKLAIERRSIDILMDHIPWNYSVIKLPWMEKPLYIEW